MKLKHEHILIISDIEGSSNCWNYEMSSFKTESWPAACKGMSLDVAEVVDRCFEAGVKSITVKDFHRTGYNIFPELVPGKASLVHGYEIGPIPGIGDPGPATAVLMIGMHAPSGSNGFLAHTLTSRIARLEVNGDLMSELELFSASMAPYNISPVFFSACPIACEHTRKKLPDVHCFEIDKTDRQEFNAKSWRQKLADEAVYSLANVQSRPFEPAGPFKAIVKMRDGEKVAKTLAKRWRKKFDKDELFLICDDIHQLYTELMQICYLTPLIQKILPVGLALFNLRGKLGLNWARKRLKNIT